MTVKIKVRIVLNLFIVTYGVHIALKIVWSCLFLYHLRWLFHKSMYVLATWEICTLYGFSKFISNVFEIIQQRSQDWCRRNNSTKKLRLFEVITEHRSCVSPNFSVKKEYWIKPLALQHHNRIYLWNKKIVTFSMSQELFFFKEPYQ